MGCRKRRKKEEMLRFIQHSDGVGFISEKGDLNGRGFYLCPDLICFKMAQKKYRMGRFLEIDGSIESLGTKLFLADGRFCRTGEER
jgi:predicted RNA-binding protein YlxR (DUF448 family)